MFKKKFVVLDQGGELYCNREVSNLFHYTSTKCFLLELMYPIKIVQLNADIELLPLVFIHCFLDLFYLSNFGHMHSFMFFKYAMYLHTAVRILLLYIWWMGRKIILNMFSLLVAVFLFVRWVFDDTVTSSAAKSFGTCKRLQTKFCGAFLTHTDGDPVFSTAQAHTKLEALYEQFLKAKNQGVAKDFFAQNHVCS